MEHFKKSFCNHCQICDIMSEPVFCYESIYFHDPDAFKACCWPQLKEQYTWPRDHKSRVAFIEDVFCRTGACKEMSTPFDFRVSCPHISECIQAFDVQVCDAPEPEDAEDIFEDGGEMAAHEASWAASAWDNTNYMQNYPFAKGVKQQASPQKLSKKDKKKLRKEQRRLAQAANVTRWQKPPQPEPVAVFITNGDEKWRALMAKVLDEARTRNNNFKQDQDQVSA